VVVGTGSEEQAARDWATLGGFTAGKIGSRSPASSPSGVFLLL
jgi:leucyl aminopeptidase